MTRGQRIFECVEKACPVIIAITFLIAILYQIFG